MANNSLPTVLVEVTTKVDFNPLVKALSRPRKKPKRRRIKKKVVVKSQVPQKIIVETGTRPTP